LSESMKTAVSPLDMISEEEEEQQRRSSVGKTPAEYALPSAHIPTPTRQDEQGRILTVDTNVLKSTLPNKYATLRGHESSAPRLSLGISESVTPRYPNEIESSQEMPPQPTTALPTSPLSVYRYGFLFAGAYLVLHLLPSILLNRLLPSYDAYPKFIYPPGLSRVNPNTATVSSCLCAYSMTPAYVWTLLGFITGLLVWLANRSRIKSAMKQMNGDRGSGGVMRRDDTLRSLVSDDSIQQHGMTSMRTESRASTMVGHDHTHSHSGKSTTGSSQLDMERALFDELGWVLFLAVIGTVVAAGGLWWGASYLKFNDMVASQTATTLGPWLVALGVGWCVILCDLVWLIWPSTVSLRNRWRSKRRSAV